MAKATSIVKLTAETNDYEKKIRQAQRTFSNFTKSLGVDMKKVSALGLALGAVTTAVKVAGDAFKANEALIDEWGRTTRAASAAYEGFLTALNTGDIGGYLRNIGQIVDAARKAYDELDRLGTMQTINTPVKTAQQLENQRIQTILRTGREMKGVNGEGLAGIAEGALLSKEQLDAYSKQLEDGLSKYNNIIRKEIGQSTAAIEALYDQQAKTLGMSKAEFMAGVSDFDTFERKLSMAQEYEDFEAAHTSAVTLQSSAGAFTQYRRDNVANPFESYKAWSVFKDDGALYKEIIQNIQQRAGLQSQLLSGMAQSYRQINRAGGINPYKGSGGGGGGAGEQKGLTPEQYAEWFGVAYYTALANTINSELKDAPIIQESLISEEDIAIEDKFAASIETLAERTERLHETWDLVAGSISTVGGALAGLEDPTARIIGTVMQAVATLGLAYAEASAKAAKLGPVAWLGFAATGLATFVGAASAIKNTTKGGFAEGGIVPGNYYNDQLHTADYGISSGELILNKSQQNAIASQLRQSGGMELTATVNGEQLLFVLNSYGLRTGRGKVVTSSKLS